MMKPTYIFRKAVVEDLASIIGLLLEDDLGKTRENSNLENYSSVFDMILKDPNQYLMVVEADNEVIATCHLTIMPSLTFQGSIRMNIEAVRVSEQYRGNKVGQQMFEQAISFAKDRGVKIVQLTTNKKRSRAKQFYEKLGFSSTHEGMKLYL